MRFTFCLTAALILYAGPMEAKAKTIARHASLRLNGTTWTYVFHGKKMRESIDAEGNYVEDSVSGKHIDYGMAAMKNKKACFTSAIVKKEMCWALQPVSIGHSVVATSDKGVKLKVTRVDYAKLSMPK